MIGGLETHVMTLAQGLARRAGEAGLEVTLATPAPARDWNDAAMPFRIVRQPGLFALWSLLRHADVVHLAGPTLLPMLLGLLLRKPVVVEHDIYQAACPNGLLLDQRTRRVCPNHFLARRYIECVRCNAVNVGMWKSLKLLLLTFPRHRLCGAVARNIFPSHHVGRRVMLARGVSMYHGTPDTGGHWAPSSADGGAVPCFAFTGRLVPEKGVAVLLRAAQALAKEGREFRLKIIGDGPERVTLEEMAEHFGLRSRTVFTGSIVGDELREALRGTVASIMPSTWEDVAPLAAIEHLINGRVLIASDIGGLGEIAGETSLRFPPGDAEGLASCLRRVLDEPQLAVALGEQSRHRALALFSEDRMVADHLNLYCGLEANLHQATWNSTSL